MQFRDHLDKLDILKPTGHWAKGKSAEGAGLCHSEATLLLSLKGHGDQEVPED